MHRQKSDEKFEYWKTRCLEVEKKLKNEIQIRKANEEDRMRRNAESDGIESLISLETQLQQVKDGFVDWKKSCDEQFKLQYEETGS